MPMSNAEIIQLKNKYEVYCYKHSIDPYTYDFDAKVDRGSLSFAENWNIILDDLEILTKPMDDLKQKVQDDKAKIAFEQNTINTNKVADWITKITKKSKVIGVVGSRGSGKSCLATHWLDLHRQFNPQRPCCIYKFPKPNLLPIWIQNITDMESIPKGAVMVVDEAGIEFNQFSFQSQGSRGLSDFIKVARHKDVTLLIITQNGATLTKDVRRLIDFYLLRNPSNGQLYDEISIIKRLYQNCFMLFSTETAKKKGYFIADWEVMEFVTFDLPVWWTEEISKAYDGDEETLNTSKLLYLTIAK